MDLARAVWPQYLLIRLGLFDLAVKPSVNAADVVRQILLGKTDEEFVELVASTVGHEDVMGSAGDFLVRVGRVQSLQSAVDTQDVPTPSLEVRSLGLWLDLRQQMARYTTGECS